MYNKIDAETGVEVIQNLLKDKKWLKEGESVSRTEIAGEGNMNVVLRIISNQRSFILKQSRPYVQKYQDIPAPIERIEVEHKFYNALSTSHVQSHLPSVINFDKEDHLLMISDLGESDDMTQIYNHHKISAAVVEELILILEGIHFTEVFKYPENLALRELNHQHIFVLPFEADNGFNLDEIQEGLQEVSMSYKSNEALKQKVKVLGEEYLVKGETLIHGDYYPGSWLQIDRETYVIDPEFSFLGFAEFDLGVMAAHLTITSLNERVIDQILNDYSLPFSEQKVRHYAGVEIIRRLIGLAQLPISLSLEQKGKLLDTAVQLIMD